MEKFIKALTKVKVEGQWSLGLVISDQKAMDFSVWPLVEKILVDGVLSPDEVVKKISRAFALKKWVLLEIKKNLPVEIYGQLKSLSAFNRLNLPNNAEVLMPDSTRVVVAAKKETIKSIEQFYPDFRFLFGPIIII